MIGIQTKPSKQNKKKYNLLIDAIKAKGMKVNPLLIIIAEFCDSIYTRNIELPIQLSHIKTSDYPY